MRLTANTYCNNKAKVVELGVMKLFLSYDTIIAVSYYDGEKSHKGRLDNTWGPTTGKHMNQMGVREFPVVSAEVLESMVASAMLCVGVANAKNMLGA